MGLFYACGKEISREEPMTSSDLIAGKTWARRRERPPLLPASVNAFYHINVNDSYPITREK